MLTTNQHLDQLVAAHVDFTARGMLNGPLMASALAAGAYDLDHNFPSLSLIKFSDLDFPNGNNEPFLEPGNSVSIVDEPVQGAIVVDNVLAEVKLAKKCRKSSTQFWL